jgi:hypothetical protein
MNNTLTAAHVQQFHDAFALAAQQMESRLQATVTNRGMISGASFTVNDLGAVEANQVIERYGDTELTVPDHGTRLAVLSDWDLALPVDRFDLHKLLANPQGDYVRLSMAAHNRRKDAIIYNALISAVQRATSSTVNGNHSAYSATNLPAGQTIVNGGTGLTKTKIIQAKAQFRLNEADEFNGEKLYMLYNNKALQDILGDASLTTADQLAVKMIQEGGVAREWMGFTWVPYNFPVGAAVASMFSAVAYSQSSCHFGIGDNITTDIGPRRDKRNMIQVYSAMSMGAARAREEKVVRIDFIR